MLEKKKVARVCKGLWLSGPTCVGISAGIVFFAISFTIIAYSSYLLVNYRNYIFHRTGKNGKPVEVINIPSLYVLLFNVLLVNEYC